MYFIIYQHIELKIANINHGKSNKKPATCFFLTVCGLQGKKTLYFCNRLK